MPRLPMHSLYFYLIFFSVFRNTVCISFHCHMDMDHLDIPLLSHGALESLPQNHLYSFRLLLQPVLSLPSAQCGHGREVLRYLPECSRSYHQTYQIRSSCILLTDLSVHMPTTRYPDGAGPYHQYDPSIFCR